MARKQKGYEFEQIERTLKRYQQGDDDQVWQTSQKVEQENDVWRAWPGYHHRT